MHLGTSFWILAVLVFVFTYVNGFHDGCNVVATLIASRAMKPQPALAWAAAVELLSPFAVLLIGSSVSDTIKKLVGEAFYTAPGARQAALAFITAGILAAILWNVTTWRFGIPASSSHALIGGVAGAGMAAFGTGAISWGYFWGKVVLMIFLSAGRQLRRRLSHLKAAVVADPQRQRWNQPLFYLCPVGEYDLFGL